MIYIRRKKKTIHRSQGVMSIHRSTLKKSLTSILVNEKSQMFSNVETINFEQLERNPKQYNVAILKSELILQMHFLPSVVVQ